MDVMGPKEWEQSITTFPGGLKAQTMGCICDPVENNEGRGFLHTWAGSDYQMKMSRVMPGCPIHDPDKIANLISYNEPRDEVVEKFSDNDLGIPFEIAPVKPNIYLYGSNFDQPLTIWIARTGLHGWFYLNFQNTENAWTLSLSLLEITWRKWQGPYPRSDNGMV